MKYSYVSIILLLCNTWVLTSLEGQHFIYGTVKAASGESLPAAQIQLPELDRLVITDPDGFFEARVPEAGAYELIVDYLGYQKKKITVNVDGTAEADIVLETHVMELQPVELYGTFARENTPTSYNEISGEELERRSSGSKDIPVLLDQLPSTVSTSDAGHGIGYTGLRIRGSDPTRINVNINGIPLNDAESQNVFWVDLPDIVSSAELIQVQRGVGTSSNGAGAFGATINVQTTGLQEEPYLNLNTVGGSYNTWKQNVELGTGLLDGKWAIDARLSNITSDGYIDRASADLKSFYTSGAYYGENTVIKAIVFSGKEVTYQAWYGTPESRLEGDRDEMQAFAQRNGLTDAQTDNLLTSGRTYNFYTYENQVDDYQQDHYQLHLSHQFNDNWRGSGALHYTRGRGFFEEFKGNDAFIDYGFGPQVVGMDTLTSSDLVRRRWLDNDFYGLTFNVNYKPSGWDVILGGAANRYVGDHFGEIIWADLFPGIEKDQRYYFSDAEKIDANIFLKATHHLNERWVMFGDLQLRNVEYTTAGNDNDLQDFDIDESFLFFNPKLGLQYLRNPQNRFYASLAVGQREPVRADFVDAPFGRTPESELMYDLELGYERSMNQYQAALNFYAMYYKDQLVLTGELNDVGAPLRSNVDNSYRLGVEFQNTWQISNAFDWSVNATYSVNKIEEFTETLYDYTDGVDIVENTFSNTDISFSPDLIANSQLTYQPADWLEFSVLNKYVGQQYLDNTSNEDRTIDAFFVTDLKAQAEVGKGPWKNLRFAVQVYNVLNEKYAASGYTFSYIFGEEITENFYYPQAERHIMVRLDLSF